MTREGGSYGDSSMFQTHIASYSSAKTMRGDVTSHNVSNLAGHNFICCFVCCAFSRDMI